MNERTSEDQAGHHRGTGCFPKGACLECSFERYGKNKSVAVRISGDVGQLSVRVGTVIDLYFYIEEIGTKMSFFARVAELGKDYAVFDLGDVPPDARRHNDAAITEFCRGGYGINPN